MSTTTVDFSTSFLKPFSRKAYDYAFRDPREDRRINIPWGTVRSAKTWAQMVKIPRLIKYPVAGHRILFGVTKQTVKNNVLDDLFTLLGKKNYTYNRQTGELDLMGQPWLVIGAKDEGSEKIIRGLTVGLAVGDELTLIPPSFLRMLLNRMSVAGARLYGTTNTDTPFHYVKTDLLDNAALRARGDLWEQKFTLDDNPHNGPDYRAYLEAAYKPGSLYHMRFVLGEWVTGEGAIYKDVWSEELLFDDEPWKMSNGLPGCVIPPLSKEQPADVCVSVDCGVDHPQVYGEWYNDGRVSWMTKEYWWDSHEMGRQKTDRQYRDDLVKFARKDSLVIIPPECASFDEELSQAGVWHVDADNEVLDGIKQVSTAMALKKIRFHRRHCLNTIAQLQTYMWDPKAALRGVEQPLKQKDDGPDMVRYYVRTRLQSGLASWEALN